MEEFKPTLCVICLEVKTYENCSRVIKENIKDVLDILLFKWPIELGSSVICNACYTKVFEAFRFKTLCTDTEDVIFPYISSSSGTPVDLKEIYLKEKGEEQLRSVAKDEKICRLCLQIATSECTSVRDLEVDLICKYIPEVNFNSTKEPFICKVCVDSLKTNGSFLRKHFDVHNFQNISEGEAQRGQFRVKMEEIEIKSEEDDHDTDTLPPTGQSAVCKAEGEDSIKTQPLATDQSTVKCDPIHHQLKHRMFSAIRTYKCDVCNYVTKLERNLVNHLQIHIDISEIQMYVCGTCGLKTKYKGNLVKHQLIHKHMSDVQTYKCDTCSYKTKYKRALGKHRLIHTVISEVQMYKCDKCNFETKHRGNLAPHQLKHKDSSEVEMYKCDTCSYKSKYKRVLVRHQLKHKDISSVQMYKCDICSYTTKYKTALVEHQLKHKDVSSVQMYKCDECSYRTKYKRALVKHQPKHKDVSNIQMYKCDKCDFATKHRENLPRHALRHKDISQEQMQ